MGSAYQFHSWRVFVLVCAFPAVAAIAALNTMPESPRFYLEVGDATHTFILNVTGVCRELEKRVWLGETVERGCLNKTSTNTLQAEVELFSLCLMYGTCFHRMGSMMKLG